MHLYWTVPGLNRTALQPVLLPALGLVLRATPLVTVVAGGADGALIYIFAVWCLLSGHYNGLLLTLGVASCAAAIAAG